MGAHSKFTPEIGETICKLVSLGVRLEAAAESEGVCRRTVYNWRDAGRNGKRLYVKFADDLEAALSRAEVAHTLNIIRAGAKDWRASAFFLEKRYPDQYGARTHMTHEIDKSNEELLDVAQQALDPDNYQRILAALASKRAGKI
jgi:hypothetical protein